jgi:DNA polymerase-3 subunit alpha
MAGAEQQQIDAVLAGHIFDLMEKFAGYGFNKSHSAAYALVSYQTAWLKVHYPAEFMAAVLSSEMQNTDKVVTFIEECRLMKLKIDPPDVNQSYFKFITREDGTIVYGLGAIKGVGEGPVDSIIEAREQSGSFNDLFDFTQRIDLHKCNKRTLEALLRSGALDNLGPHRATILASLDGAVATAEQIARNAASGMVDLFGDTQEFDVRVEFTEAEPWTDDERLKAEKETLGLFLTGHPINQYESELPRFVEQRIVDVQPTRRGITTTIAGLVMSVDVKRGDRGTRAFVVLDDRTGRIEAMLFSEAYEAYKELLIKDTVIVVEGEVSFDTFRESHKLSVRKIMTLAEARSSRCKGVEITLEAGQLGSGFSADLRELLAKVVTAQGGAPIRLKYRNHQAEAVFKLGDAWRVSVKDELLRKLRHRYGAKAVEVLY